VASMFLRFIIETVQKSSSKDLSCPIKVGNYSFKNMRLDFPTFVPSSKGYFCVEAKLSGKSKSNRKQETIISVIAVTFVK
jgi:hypothetical protein